jgi:hypothetical protein
MTEWKKDLGDFFARKQKAQVERKQTEIEKFISTVVLPAFQDVKVELEKYDRVVSTRHTPNSASLSVQHRGADEFMYSVQGRTFPDRVLPYAEVVSRERKGVRLIRTESMLRSGQDYRMAEISKGEVIQHILSHYTSKVGLD